VFPAIIGDLPPIVVPPTELVSRAF
jgi:hypothetical protein